MNGKKLKNIPAAAECNGGFVNTAGLGASVEKKKSR